MEAAAGRTHPLRQLGVVNLLVPRRGSGQRTRTLDETRSPQERWSPPDLREIVACVTGASYGVGRGIAEVLGECGATVYVTGRSTNERPRRSERWSVEETAELVRVAGGTGIAAAVDHTQDAEVAQLFARIDREQSRLDLLVSNVWQWGPADTYLAPTWQQPVSRWDAMFGVGVRSHFTATQQAIPIMLAHQGGLIVLTQERPGDAERFSQNIVVDVAAVAMRRMVEYLARELEGEDITALLLYPGWVRSVNMGMGFDPARAGMSPEEFLAQTQSLHLIGRAVATLAADAGVGSKSGRAIYAGDVAHEYGFTDVDGRVPPYGGTE